MNSGDPWTRDNVDGSVVDRSADYAFSEVDPDEDEWVSTICNGCYAFCGAKVHVVDGTIVGVKGDQDAPNGRGRLCAKGQAIMGGALHYDPYRVTTPLRRTNEKGPGVDPGWEPIAWEEALELVEEQVAAALPERQLYFQASTNKLCFQNGKAFFPAFGSRGFGINGGSMCAGSIHTVTGMNSGTWEPRPDYEYTDYVIFWGSQHGAAAGHAYNTSVFQRQQAWRDGAHVVCIDPLYNKSAEKADEWVPIRPGTDGAFILAMVNLYLNEWETYDAPFLKASTNGPFLVGPDGTYRRDPATDKCLVWDPVDERAKPFDDETIQDYALFGAYEVDGVVCETGLEKIRAGVEAYTVAFAAEECDVPAATIERIAREFVEHARLGSTITIDGEELRHRPATIYYLQGINGHDQGMMNVMGLEIVLNLLGIRGAVGGQIGSMTQAMQPSDDGVPHPTYRATTNPKDGHLVLSPPQEGLWFLPEFMYPVRAAEDIDTYRLDDVQSTVGGLHENAVVGYEDHWGLPELEVVINLGANEAINHVNSPDYLEQLRDTFYVRFAVHLDEAAEALADVVLPTTVALESTYNFPWGWSVGGSGTGGMAEPEYGYYVRQPVVDPPGEARPVPEVLLELVHRMDLTPTFNYAFNEMYALEEPYRLDPATEYSWEEILDREVQSLFDEDHDRAWFEEHGPLTWEKSVEEVYWMQFLDSRASIYFEGFETLGERLQDLFESRDLEWRYDDYVGVPEHRPCASKHEPPEYDLHLISHRTSFNAGSWTDRIPWIDQINELDWEAYGVVMHPDAAAERGLEEGDVVRVENAIGHASTAPLVLSEGIRRDCLGAPQTGGRREREGLCPTGNNKGLREAALTGPFRPGPEASLDYTNLISGAPDMDVKVRVTPAADGGR